MDAVTYPRETVEAFINQRLVPWRIAYRKEKGLRERFGVNWTPTVLFLDTMGRQLYRIMGYLPPETFEAHLHLGKAHAAFGGERYLEAREYFEAVLDKFPDSEQAPQAMYFRGVCDYKMSDVGKDLVKTRLELQKAFPQSEWAQRAAIWGRS